MQEYTACLHRWFLLEDATADDTIGYLCNLKRGNKNEVSWKPQLAFLLPLKVQTCDGPSVRLIPPLTVAHN